MTTLDRLRKELTDLKADARRVHEESPNDYDAGRYEGFKQAIEALDLLVERWEKQPAECSQSREND